MYAKQITCNLSLELAKDVCYKSCNVPVLQSVVNLQNVRLVSNLISYIIQSLHCFLCLVKKCFVWFQT